MKLPTRKALWLTCTLMALSVIPKHAMAETFLNPIISEKAGYISNRFLDDSEEGSLYSTTAASFSLYYLGSSGSEGEGTFYFAETDYLESGFSHSREYGFKFSSLGDYGAAVLNASLYGGRFRDMGSPEEDADFLELVPSISLDISESATAGLTLSAKGTRYPS
ncbi:MAG: hypothetical protein C0609_06380, partial [Deltaproteobacteria bacterium]